MRMRLGYAPGGARRPFAESGQNGQVLRRVPSIDRDGKGGAGYIPLHGDEWSTQMTNRMTTKTGQSGRRYDSVTITRY